MAKCQAFFDKEHKQKCSNEASWAWQPFGPGETADEFVLLGSHARGFPTVKICGDCKGYFQRGDFPVYFAYKGHRYIAENHQVREQHVSLWIGQEWMTTDLNPFEARAIMRDTPDRGPDLIALVSDADLIQSFVIAPTLVEDCETLMKLRDKIKRWSEFSYVGKADRDAVLMALAAIQVTLDRRGKE